MNKSNIIKLAISLVIPLAVGSISGIVTAQSVSTWYASLNRPSFAPPNWLFGPVWTSLYILLGISFFIIWKQNSSKERNRAIAVFLLQMFLNFGWTFCFFYFKIIGLALVEIIFLWITIVTMLFLFYKIKPVAAYLNFPYLFWVSFATVLTADYYFLN
jgi:tryptophan-rich sensory protein